MVSCYFQKQKLLTLPFAFAVFTTLKTIALDLAPATVWILKSTIFMAIVCIVVFSPVIYQEALKRLYEHAPNSFPTQDK